MKRFPTCIAPVGDLYFEVDILNQMNRSVAILNSRDYTRIFNSMKKDAVGEICDRYTSGLLLFFARAKKEIVKM